MKLLKKSIIQSDLAFQRKQQIDEGILIAQKVDALRQTLASLESQHKRFVEGTKRELEKEIQSLVLDIQNFKVEILSLKEKREKLLEPLTVEWKLVRDKALENQNISDALDSKMFKIVEKEQKVIAQGIKAKEVLARINSRERELLKIYERAADNEKDTEVALKEAESIRAKATKHFEDTNVNLLNRESVVAISEREIEIERKQIESDKSELVKARIQLADQRKTLERAFNRLKK